MPPVRINAGHFSPDTRAFFSALANDTENLRLLFAGLESFWDGDIPGIDSPDAFAPDGMVVQFGQPPNRIDLVNSIDGVSFDEAWAGRVHALVKNKRASGRPKDLDDLNYLIGDG